MNNSLRFLKFSHTLSRPLLSITLTLRCVKNFFSTDEKKRLTKSRFSVALSDGKEITFRGNEKRDPQIIGGKGNLKSNELVVGIESSLKEIKKLIESSDFDEPKIF